MTLWSHIDQQLNNSKRLKVDGYFVVHPIYWLSWLISQAQASVSACLLCLQQSSSISDCYCVHLRWKDGHETVKAPKRGIPIFREVFTSVFLKRKGKKRTTASISISFNSYAMLWGYWDKEWSNVIGKNKILGLETHSILKSALNATQLGLIKMQQN